MCDEGHPTRECLQDRGGACQRERLEGFAARQHQHDKRASKVLLEQYRCDDGDAGEQIGAELAPNQLERKGQHKGYTAGCEHDVQGQIACGRRSIGAPAQGEMRSDPATASPAMIVARSVVIGHGHQRRCRGLAVGGTSIDGLATFIKDDYASGR